MPIARLFACLAVSALAGCYSTSIAQTPSTVPPGKLRWGIGMQGYGSTSHSAGLSPEVSLRVGVLDRLDVGAKAGFQSLEVQAKGQLVRGDFDLSLALSGATSRDPDDKFTIDDEGAATYDWMRSARAMLIAGQRVSDSLDLVLMGDGQFGVRSGRDRDPWQEHFAGVGGGFGVLFKSRAQFLPEVVVTQYVVGESSSQRALQAGDTRIQFTVTGLLGGNDEHDAR